MLSYDLYLMRIPSGADPIACFEELLEREEDEELNPGDPVPEKEEKKRAIARALMEVGPELEVFRFDYAEIAQITDTSEAEARHRHRHLELNGPDEGPGIQITLFDDTASITLPYWHSGDKARQVWHKLWGY